jgi:hypothetical protein
MISGTRKQAIRPWVPAGFCAALSVITIAVSLCISVFNRSSNEWLSGLSGFLCFLPVCFVWVGQLLSEMRSEISELRKQVVELQRANDART